MTEDYTKLVDAVKKLHQEGKITEVTETTGYGNFGTEIVGRKTEIKAEGRHITMTEIENLVELIDNQDEVGVEFSVTWVKPKTFDTR